MSVSGCCRQQDRDVCLPGSSMNEFGPGGLLDDQQSLPGLGDAGQQESQFLNECRDNSVAASNPRRRDHGQRVRRSTMRPEKHTLAAKAGEPPASFIGNSECKAAAAFNDALQPGSHFRCPISLPSGSCPSPFGPELQQRPLNRRSGTGSRQLVERWRTKRIQSTVRRQQAERRQQLTIVVLVLRNRPGHAGSIPVLRRSVKRDGSGSAKTRELL